MRRYYFTHFRIVATNNDGQGNDTTGTGGNPAGTFTQAQVDEMLSKERNAAKGERDKTVAQLEQLKKAQGLSEKEKKDLQAQIDQLQSMNLSKEELARQQADQLKKTYEDEKTSLVGERDKWRGQYEEYRLQSEILSAANGANAFNPAQLVELLMPKAKLVELKENVGGQEQTVYTPIVKFSDKDKDGKPVVLDLSIGDAIKRMKDQPAVFGNLFKSDANGGTGLMNNGGGSNNTKGGFRPGMSAEEYAQWRKSQPFGSKIK